MKRVQLFNGIYTKGVSFVKNSIYKGKGLDLGAKPLPVEAAFDITYGQKLQIFHDSVVSQFPKET